MRRRGVRCCCCAGRHAGRLARPQQQPPPHRRTCLSLRLQLLLRSRRRCLPLVGLQKCSLAACTCPPAQSLPRRRRRLSCPTAPRCGELRRGARQLQRPPPIGRCPRRPRCHRAAHPAIGLRLAAPAAAAPGGGRSEGADERAVRSATGNCRKGRCASNTVAVGSVLRAVLPPRRPPRRHALVPVAVVAAAAAQLQRRRVVGRWAVAVGICRRARV